MRTSLTAFKAGIYSFLIVRHIGPVSTVNEWNFGAKRTIVEYQKVRWYKYCLVIRRQSSATSINSLDSHGIFYGRHKKTKRLFAKSTDHPDWKDSNERNWYQGYYAEGTVYVKAHSHVKNQRAQDWHQLCTVSSNPDKVDLNLKNIYITRSAY